MKLVRICVAIAVPFSSAAIGGEIDVEGGRVLGREVCAACHDIGRDRPWAPSLQPPAPSFAALSRRGKLNETHLRAFLTAPHGDGAKKTNMPNPQLLDYQIDRLVAWLRASHKAR